jgi:hypothetical protein
MIGRQLDNMLEMEDYLEKECQDINFTIVRPPRLLDQPLEGRFLLINLELHLSKFFKWFKSNRIDTSVSVAENAYYFADYSTRNQIPRANVAKFMLDSLDAGTYFKKGVAIDLPKPTTQ